MTLSKDNIWIDGCFDFFHHGHANAILQAKQYGSNLTIGIHSDEEILHNKGPTVMKLNERIVSLEGNKWVNKIVPNAPYVTDPKLMDLYDCFYVIHGDDITTDSEGNDCYGIVRDQGRLKLVKRTQGVSTTDLINRLLIKSKNPNGLNDVDNDGLDVELIKKFGTDRDGKTLLNDVWKWEDGELVTIQKNDTVGSNDVPIIYVHGDFDLFSPYHIKSLEHLHKIKPGKRIIVGISKSNQNIMNLLQRSLCVLQCKYVDGLIIGISSDDNDRVRDHFNIDSIYDINTFDNEFNYLKQDGIFNRILQNLQSYQDRQLRKLGKSEVEEKMKIVV